jgi:hypothetical protein
MRRIAYAADKEIASLDDDAVLNMLFSEADKVRKAIVLRIIKSLSKSRLNRLLDRYMSHATFYYNVVHWLDMGISIGKQQVRGVVDRTIAKEWPRSYPSEDE